MLPVGCGKSGLISVTPFAVQARRVLVVAPGTRIRGQLADDLRASSPTNVYERFGVLESRAQWPEVAVVESGRINMDDIRHADVVVANIQQIAGDENRWLWTPTSSTSFWWTKRTTTRQRVSSRLSADFRTRE